MVYDNDSCDESLDDEDLDVCDDVVSEEDGDPVSPVDAGSARLIVVRLYNGSAMLDSAEGRACGVVSSIPKLKCWRKYGLNVGGLETGGGVSTPYLPSFKLSDDFLISSSFSSVAGQHAPYHSEVEILPAGARLGNVLVVAHFKASQRSLSLPTLSKSRLPMGDKRIEAALEASVGCCLGKLREKNPGMLLSREEIIKRNRDVRDIEIVGEGIGNIIRRMGDVALMRSLAASPGAENEFADSDEEEEVATAMKKRLKARIRDAIERMEGRGGGGGGGTRGEESEGESAEGDGEQSDGDERKGGE